MPSVRTQPSRACGSTGSPQPAHLLPDPQSALQAYVSRLTNLRPALTCPRLHDDSFCAHEAAFVAVGRPYWAEPLFQDVLVALAAIFRARSSAFGDAVPSNYAAARGLNVLFSVIESDDPALVAFMPLMLASFKACCLPYANDYQRSQVRHLATAVVKASLDSGDLQFVRTTAYDDAIAFLFPDLVPSLAPGAPGTVQYAGSRPLGGLNPSVERWDALCGPDDAFFLECIDAAESARVFDLRWTRGSDVDFDKWSRFEDVCKLSRSDARLVRDAYEARRAGTDFPGFILDQEMPEVSDVSYLIRLLSSIYMLS